MPLSFTSHATTLLFPVPIIPFLTYLIVSSYFVSFCLPSFFLTGGMDFLFLSYFGLLCFLNQLIPNSLTGPVFLSDTFFVSFIYRSGTHLYFF
uniref:Uncharacterized protein n=1 Tax=Arundo donax TaxID=35708 RepID=A0A0A9HU65_ARUDO